MERNLLEEIRNLDEKTKTEDIVDIILYDFRKEVMPNEAEIEEFFKKKKSDARCNKVIKEFNDYQSLVYENDNNNLKNWLRYRILAHGAGYPMDCDTSELTWSILNELYNIDFRNPSDFRHCSKNNKTFESDTLNSVQTLFGQFMRKKYGDEYRGRKDFERDYKVLTKLMNKDFEKREIFKKINAFALLTYTLGNFGLVPKGFNCYRNFKFNDIWDKSYDYLQKDEKLMPEIDDMKIVIDGFSSSDYDKLYLRNDHSLSISDYEKKCMELIENINTFILTRGIKIIQIINKNVKLNEEEILQKCMEKLQGNKQYLYMFVKPSNNKLQDYLGIKFKGNMPINLCDYFSEKKVRDFCDSIPKELDSKKLEEFYKRTGFKINHVINNEKAEVNFDMKGSYSSTHLSEIYIPTGEYGQRYGEDIPPKDNECDIEIYEEVKTIIQNEDLTFYVERYDDINYYAIGDIHGNLDLLKETLELVDLQDNKESKLIFLGDYIDGENDSYRALNYIKLMTEKYGEQVIALMGNHEEMFLEWLSNPKEYLNYFIEDKDLHTLRTFINESEYKTIYYEINQNNDIVNASKTLADIIKNNHKELISWLKELPYYFETENQIYVHAGIDEEAEDLWKTGTPKHYFTNKFPATTGQFEKDIIAGHVGVTNFRDNKSCNEIYWDGKSHFYIDGIDGNQDSDKYIPILKYNKSANTYTSFRKNEEYSIDEENNWKQYIVKK